jgi:hypothetical protein
MDYPSFVTYTVICSMIALIWSIRHDSQIIGGPCVKEWIFLCDNWYGSLNFI